jgi:hypothetical protein
VLRPDACFDDSKRIAQERMKHSQPLWGRDIFTQEIREETDRLGQGTAGTIGVSVGLPDSAAASEVGRRDA